MKSIPKYYFLLLGNLILLILLLFVWSSDCLERYFIGNQIFFEISKIIGISVLAWYTILKVEKYSSKIAIVKNESKKKIVLAFSVIALISSYKYVQYSGKIINHHIINSSLRGNICKKLIPNSGAFIKSEGVENLSFIEYQEIKRLTPLPEIPKEADSINYSYILFDDFLGDYTFTFCYVVPLEITIDTSSYKNMSYSQIQYFEIKNNLKYVTYSERKS